MEEVMNADFADQQGATGPQRGSEPLFKVETKLCHEEKIPETEIHDVQIEPFVLPPRGTSVQEEFDLLAHLELEPEKEEGEEEEEEEGEKEEDEIIEPIYKKVVPNIQTYWLRMQPDKNDYIEVIIKTFASGLDKIKSFERWSKHNDLTPYADALEEWDEKVGDSWEEPDSLKLDPKTWIQDDPLYLDQRIMVSKIMESSFSKVTQFLTTFQAILEIYWRNKQFDPSILVNETLMNPIEGL
jgi:hypothetical protein